MGNGAEAEKDRTYTLHVVGLIKVVVLEETFCLDCRCQPVGR